MEKVELITEDGIKIIGDYYEAQKSDAPAVILLHMMPETRVSWRDFAPLLVERGFQVLAIDERGHGESTMGGELNYQKFSDDQQQAKKFDVLAVRKFFVDKGISAENIFVGGGSIGANLAIQYMAEHPECRAGFALSPGFNYRGIGTRPLMEKLNSEQSIYLVGAKDDPNVSGNWEQVEKLSQIGPAQKQLKIFETGGHAENVLKTHHDFAQELADWLKKFL